MKYQIGQQIYYTGDMANHEGRFEITAIDPKSAWGTYTLTETGNKEKPRTIKIGEIQISPEYKGHCGTRFSPYESYQAWREQAYNDMIARMSQRKSANA